MKWLWFKDQKSDEEFVQEVREQLESRSKWRRWGAPVVLLVNLPVLVVLATSFERLIEPLTVSFGLPLTGAMVAFLFGATMGCSLGMLSGLAFDMLGIFGDARRRDELLVTLFDEAKPESQE